MTDREMLELVLARLHEASHAPFMSDMRITIESLKSVLYEYLRAEEEAVR